MQNKRKSMQVCFVLLRFWTKVSSMIRWAKHNMYKTKIEKGKDDPRPIWKIFMDFGASRKIGAKDTILGLKDRLISDENEIANVFNKYFLNVASQLKELVKHSDFKHITEYVDSKAPSNTYFSIPEITSSFVGNFLVNTNVVTKATGLGCIGPKLLKISPDVLSFVS